jgi:hypothetical protein
MDVKRVKKKLIRPKCRSRTIHELNGRENMLRRNTFTASLPEHDPVWAVTTSVISISARGRIERTLAGTAPFTPPICRPVAVADIPRPRPVGIPGPFACPGMLPSQRQPTIRVRRARAAMFRLTVMCPLRSNR